MLWWAGLVCWLLTACQAPTRSPITELVRRSEPLLGTFVTITAYGPQRDQINQAISEAFAEFHRIDGLMSIHRADSELSGVNQKAAQESVPVSPDLFKVLKEAGNIGQQTDGAFDVTVRPLLDLWGFIWKEYRLPLEAELEKVLPHVDCRNIILDEQSKTVHFRTAGTSIDLGGIAKGFAVDCAIEKLQRLGITNAMVKAGGDLRVIGHPPGQPFWQIQLEDPRKEQRRHIVHLRDAALSTSGNYENFFEVGAKRYSHILDPRTGLPVQGIAACTVIAPTCMESDAWATACFVYGIERSLANFGQRFPMRFVSMPAHQSGSWKVTQTESFSGHN